MYALSSSRLSPYTSACTCWRTRGAVPPCVVSSTTWGLRTISRSSRTKPSGTVSVATTLPVSSCRSASSGERRTSSTSSRTRSSVRSMWKRCPPRTSVSGRPSRSTSATRGFAFAYAATRPTSIAITSGYASRSRSTSGDRRRTRRSLRRSSAVFFMRRPGRGPRAPTPLPRPRTRPPRPAGRGRARRSAPPRRGSAWRTRTRRRRPAAARPRARAGRADRGRARPSARPGAAAADPRRGRARGRGAGGCRPTARRSGPGRRGARSGSAAGPRPPLGRRPSRAWRRARGSPEGRAARSGPAAAAPSRAPLPPSRSVRHTGGDRRRPPLPPRAAGPPAWDWSFLEDGALALDPHELWAEPPVGLDAKLSQSPRVSSRLNRRSSLVTVPRTMPSPRAVGSARVSRRSSTRSLRRFAALALVVCVAVTTLTLTAFGTGVYEPASSVPAPRERLLPTRPQPQTIALRDSMRVQLPVAQTRVTAIGYHATGGGALALEPLGRQGNRGLLGRVVDRLFGGGDSGLVWYQLAGGSGPATAGLVVGASPETDVYSPVDGTVIGITRYELNGKGYGSRVDIQPASAPSLVVSVTRVKPDPALDVGSSVVSAGTRIGTVIDLSRVERQGPSRDTQDAGNHVTIEVFPA